MRTDCLGRRSRSGLLLASALAASALLSANATADPFTWGRESGGGAWEDADNWQGVVAPPADDTDTDLVFQGSLAGGTLTYSQSYTLNSVLLDSSIASTTTFSASVGGLTLTFGGMDAKITKDSDGALQFATTNDPTIHLADTITIDGAATAGILTFLAPVTGGANANVIKNGAFDLQFMNRTGLLGEIQINEGALVGTSSTGLSGNILVNAGGMLRSDGAPSQAALTAPAYVKLNGGTLSYNGTFRLGSGGSVIEAMAGTTSVIQTNAGAGNLPLGDGTAPITLAGTGTLTKTGGATMIANIANTSWDGQWDIVQGVLQLANPSTHFDVTKNVHLRDTGRLLVNSTARTFNGRVTGVSSTTNNTDGVISISGNLNVTFGSTATVSPGDMADGGIMPNDAATLKVVAGSTQNRNLIFSSGSTYRANVVGLTGSDLLYAVNTNTGRSDITFSAGSKLDVVLFQGKTDIAAGSWTIAEAATTGGVARSLIAGVDATLASNTSYKVENDASALLAGSGWSGLSTATALSGEKSTTLVVTGSYKAADGSLTGPAGPVRVLVGGAANAVNFDVTVANADDDGAADLNNYTISGDNLISSTGTGLAEGTDVVKTLGFDPTGLTAGEYARNLTLTSSTSPDAGGSVTAHVLDHANASFSSDADDNQTSLNLIALPGAGTQTANLAVYNLESTAGFTAAMDLDSLVITPVSGDSDVLQINAGGLSGLLLAGGSTNLVAVLDTSIGAGTYSAVYELTFADEALAGAAATTMEVTLHGEVSALPEPASLGLLALGGVSLLARRRRLGKDGSR